MAQSYIVQMKKLLDMAQKQIAFAASVAINRTAMDARNEVYDQMPSIFDKPTPFIMRSLYVNKSRVASKSKGTEAKLEAEIGFRHYQSNILNPMVDATQRGQKPYEKLLARIGVLKSNEYTIPSDAEPKSLEGNVFASRITQMLSSLQAHRDVGVTSNSTRKRGQHGKFFVLNINGKKQIWFRHDAQSAYPMLFVASRARYKRIFNFKEIIDAKVNEVMDRHMKDALEFAWRTAKV